MRIREVGLLGVLCVALAAGGCGAKTKPPEAVAANARPSEAPSNPHLITVDDNLRNRIRVGELASAEVGEELVVAARVEVDETRVVRIGSPVQARVLSLSVQEGQEVQEGQILAEVNSVEVSGAQLEYLKALSQKQMALRAVDRAKILRDAEVIGAAELQRREAELEQIAAEADAAKDQLMQLGMTAGAVEALEKTRAIRSSSRITASMTGTVLARRIAVGQVVQPADTMFEIADLSKVWLVADVPEQNAGPVKIGQAVEAEIAALPGRDYRGKLSFVSATLNPETRTVRARMELANPQRDLKPAMLATMTFRHHVDRRPVVPTSAVVRDGDSEFVFIERSNDSYELKEVGLGMESEGRRVVLDGIKATDRIVLEGAFHLNNERRRRAIRGSGS